VTDGRGDAEAPEQERLLPARRRLLVVSGPNLQLLGTREPSVYGRVTLPQIHAHLETLAEKCGASVEARQSNHEGDLVTWVGESGQAGFSGVLLNPGGYGHTSIALHDAVKASGLPTVEVHLSHTDAREEFRRRSRIGPACIARVGGFGARSYELALLGLLDLLDRRTDPPTKERGFDRGLTGTLVSWSDPLRDPSFFAYPAWLPGTTGPSEESGTPMRARAGDPPRTMPQKILAGRAADPQLRGDLVQAKVDQVILSRAPARAFAEALAAGLKKTPIEVAVAYDGTCVTDAASNEATAASASFSAPSEMLAHGIQIAKAGIGYPAPVHLERFGFPARLALTDDPRLASLGGVGMLVLVTSPGQLAQALAQGSVWLRPPRSVQILLSGRTRPFVCARDVALELLRRGIDEIVRKIEAQYKAPVVLEFAGTSARLLNVSERSVLAGMAPLLGAQAGIFLSDEKTESYLRDQRRSKAHRTLFADQGAPCDHAISIDLGTVDPLLLDETGQVRAVRDLAGKPVHQVVLGGDTGVTLRDMLAAAQLLKSKRLPSRVDFLVAPPSRQVLEVLASTGALTDLAATGARIIEPDRRTMTGEMYPTPPGKLSIRTCDPEPRGTPFIVASAETVAYTVATGAIGDPRSFKRPVRVTVPRVLPTDDVLVVKERRAAEAPATKKTPVAPPAAVPWKAAVTLDLVKGLPKVAPAGAPEIALLLTTLDDLRAFAGRAIDYPQVRAIIGNFIPSGIAHSLAGLGIAVFSTEEIAALESVKSLALPAPSAWGEGVTATAGKTKVALTWTAIGNERPWMLAGTSRPAPVVGKSR
jgi:aconitate hydratase